MSNADTVGAVFGLLLGLAAHNTPGITATAEAAPSGPVVAIDKARNAAAAESRRARAIDQQAAEIEQPSEPASAPDAPAAATKAAAESVANAAAGAVPAVPGAADDAGHADGAVATGATAGGYDPDRHRDPFRPPNLTAAVASDKGSPRTPLEAYELGQLKLVGIVRDKGSVRAMVEDSAGLGYIVTAGTPIGSSGGVVRDIEPRRVLIEETTTNFYGEKQAKEVVMELPQEDRSP